MKSDQPRHSGLLARPELLAPAGDWDCVRAAVENGADAIYFGLDCGFNARARADNFSAEELPRLMTYLRQRGVRGYVTLNVLVFPSELAAVEEVIRVIIAAGVDAILVQDLGVARLIRTLCPRLPIHASTQMTLTSAECIAVAKSLGIDRVVLPRELSIAEIGKIHHQTDVPLEAFAHGALCVAYSGQCLTSESLGGRSANRGRCAQACRLPYELVCDGDDVPLGDMKYLLSPQDLAAFELVPEMLKAGVVSFKIEGRLKTAEYVANITRHYRQAIDKACAGQLVRFTPRQIEEMELSFSRGFSPGWLHGCDHKMLVPGLSSAKRGVLLGTVVRLRGQRVEVQLASGVARGDGIVFAGDRAHNNEQGGRVYEVFRFGKPIDDPISNGRVELGFARNAIDFSKLSIGQAIWKTDDPKLSKRLRATFSGPDAVRRMPVDIDVTAIVGRPLQVFASAASGATARVHSDTPLEAAVKHPASENLMREQLGRLGGTVFELRRLAAEIVDQPMVPLSVLGKIRRAMIAELEAAAAEPPAFRQTINESALAQLRATLPPLPREQPVSGGEVGQASLRILCRTLGQLTEVVKHTDEVFVDFQDIRQYREAVQLAHASDTRIFLATPRIQKPDEASIFRVLMRHEADGILVRNLAGLAYFVERGVPVIADYSLNAANELTTQYLHKLGARRTTVSYDLNREQLLDLVSATPPEWLEIVVHQHMPMFHMEHCVFCAVLSPGTDKTNCGRPCDFHEVRLRDRIGMEHPLKADVGCRNTLFNAVPQSSAEVVPTLREHGVRDFRIELLDESPREVQPVIELYRELLAGRIAGKEVWKRLKAANRVGVTRGTLDERRNPLAIL